MIEDVFARRDPRHRQRHIRPGRRAGPDQKSFQLKIRNFPSHHDIGCQKAGRREHRYRDRKQHHRTRPKPRRGDRFDDLAHAGASRNGRPTGGIGFPFMQINVSRGTQIDPSIPKLDIQDCRCLNIRLFEGPARSSLRQAGALDRATFAWRDGTAGLECAIRSSSRWPSKFHPRLTSFNFREPSYIQ